MFAYRRSNVLFPRLTPPHAVSRFSRTPVRPAFLPALAALCLAACARENPRMVEAPRMEVLARLDGNQSAAITASPGGQLYLSLGTTLYRLREEGGRARLHPLATLGAAPTVLHAPAEDDVFFLVQASPEIGRWRPARGVESMPHPLRDSTFPNGDRADRINLLDLWGPSPGEGYAVGDYGAILRFDGARWALEANPLVPLARRGAPDVYRSYLWSVGGGPDGVQAAGMLDVLSRDHEGWSGARLPGTDSTTSWMLALGSAKGAYLVGRNERTRELLLFHRPAGGGWAQLPGALKAVRHEALRGRGQPDGSVVFWTPGGEVVRLVGERVTVYRRLELASVGGAAVRGQHLYVVGASRAATVILRLNLES